MSTITTSDKRINTRSPYYIDSREAPEPVIPPDPIEENTPPTVSITVSKESPSVGETVTLTAVASDSDGTIVSYLWGGTASPQTTVSIDVTNTEVQSKTYYVVVTDDDGDTATASATVHWQEAVSNPIETFIVNCGDTVNEGTFSYQKKYILNVGDKIGDVEIEFLTTGNPQEVPVNFELEWNGSTSTSGFIGGNDYYDTLEEKGIPVADINTGEPSTKGSPTTLTINKTASAPSQVNLTATAFLPNDNYSFTLNCPDVEETETFFHTLTGTCITGDTTFTYTDVNGETQEVILANGQTELVSAQDGTVSAAICTGSVEKGGQSFDLGKPEQIIDLDTEFVFWLDTSGSLDNEVAQLENMINNELRNSFLTYYNDDNVIYNNKVIYRRRRTENFLNWAQVPRSSSSSKTVISIYIDESAATYHPYAYNPSYNVKTSSYNFDIIALRDRLDSQTNFGDHLVIVFCIEKDIAGVYKQFSHFIDNVSTGANGYDGSGGLSDRSEVIFVRNVLPEQNSSYYHQLTIEALQDLGYKI